MSGEFIGKAKQFMVDQLKDTTVAHAAQRNLNRRDFLKLAGAGALSVFLAACQTWGDKITPTVNPGVTPTPETGPTTIAPETKVTSGELSMVTDQAKRNEIISSLPKDRPQVEGGDQNIETFKIAAGGTDFNFAMYNLTQDEINNGVAIETIDANGKKTVIVQSVALYSQIVDYSGKASWTRLIGIDVPQTDPNGKPEHGIIWVYDANGFPKPPNLPVIGTDPSGKPIVDTSKAPAVDLSRPVLAYVVPPQNPNKISFAPLTSEPSQMVRFNTPKPLDVKVGESSPNEIQVSPVVFKFTSENTGAPVSAVTTETPTPEKTYPICEAKDFRNCPITVEDLAFKGPLWNFVRTKSQPFDATKLKWLQTVDQGNGVLIPIPDHAPNYVDPATRPFRKHTEMAFYINYQGTDYIIYPVEYADPKDPTNPEKNTWAFAVNFMRYIKRDNSGLDNPLSKGDENWDIKTWTTEMNIAPVIPSFTYPGTSATIPLIQDYWNTIGPSVMQDKFQKYQNGDPTALDGIIFLTDTGSGGAWYK